MKTERAIAGLFTAAVFAASPAAVMAADHIDAPAAQSEPAADITDLYAWMTGDAEMLNLVLDVSPFATDASMFSDAVQYVFHVGSADAPLAPNAEETTIICEFDASQEISCWAGDDEYVNGDASDASGIMSESGDLRVFAGLRNDPFFMEFTGFTETVSTVVSVAGDLDFDAAGCPAVDDDTSAALVTQLQSGAAVEGEEGLPPASDTFAGTNVLSIVIQVDKDVVNSGGDVLNVWASTRRAE